MNYDFSQKRHWRRSLWNCIADRVTVPRRDALCLYLAGERDEDRPVATSKGFAAGNLIAMERDANAVKELRAAGVLTLEGDALKHVQAWRPGRKVDVLILDLCCGLTPAVMECLFSLATHPSFQSATVAVNLLRGRDSASNEARELAVKSIQEMLNEGGNGSTACRMGLIGLDEMEFRLRSMFGSHGSKHRGELLRMLFIRQLTLWVMSNMAAEAGMQIDELQHGMSPAFDADMTARCAQFIDRPRWQTLSYRSTANQTFDTLVYVNDFVKFACFQFDEKSARLNAEHEGSHLRRQQAAIMAHRTRRMT